MKGDAAAIHDQGLFRRAHLPRPGAKHAIVLKEIGAGCQRLDLIDQDKLEISRIAHENAQKSTANPAKAVDRNANGFAWHGALRRDRSIKLTL